MFAENKQSKAIYQQQQ